MKKEKDQSTETKRKAGLFDHLNQIRKTKNPDYFSTLDEDDLKTFNQYMLLRFLSMDSSIIEEISLISKYLNLIPNSQFYTLCINLLPKSNYFFKYIKSDFKKPNKELVDIISQRYMISSRESIEYITECLEIDGGIYELEGICREYGFTNKEIKKICEIER